MKDDSTKLKKSALLLSSINKEMLPELAELAKVYKEKKEEAEKKKELEKNKPDK